MAAQSYMDILTDSIKTEISAYFTDRSGELPGGAPLKIAIAGFDDPSGRYSADAGIIRQLLFGKLETDSRYQPVPLADWDAAYKAVTSGAPDSLSMEQLKSLAAKSGAAYLFFGRVRQDQASPQMQGYLYSLRKGVLIYTPQFPLSQTLSPSAPIPPEETEPAPIKQEKETENPSAPAPEPQKPAAVNAPAQKPFALPAGRLEPLKGDIPVYPIVDLDGISADGKSTPTVFLMTTRSLEVYSLRDGVLKQAWVGNYKNAYPRRGLAGRILVEPGSALLPVVISMNVFDHSFLYAWDGTHFKKVKNLDVTVVDQSTEKKMRLVSNYGSGIISFSGKETALIDAAGSASRTVPFRVPFDYYSACVMHWGGNATENTRAVFADTDGRLHVIESSGIEKAVTEPAYGGEVNCWTSPSGAQYVLTTTAAWKNDALVLLAYDRNALQEKWRSRQVAGGIFHQKFVDMDRNGLPEAIGIIEAKDAPTRLFVAVPEFPQGSKQ